MPNYCIDCRHFREQRRKPRCLCARPRPDDTSIAALVLGEFYARCCSDERGSTDPVMCGRDGQFFERAQPGQDAA